MNPPVVQGWAWCLALAGIAAALFGCYSVSRHGPGDGQGILLILGPMPLWFAAELVGAFFSHDVELRDGDVCVRRWTDVWFGRPGRRVGARSNVHAVLSCGVHLHMAADQSVVEVSMAMWPRSSRHSLEQRFEAWGIELEFPGRHHAHHPRHWNHGHHRLTHTMPERGQHRRQPADDAA